MWIFPEKPVSYLNLLYYQCGEMKLHDSIRVKDLNLDGGIKVHDEADEIFATVIEMKGFNGVKDDLSENQVLIARFISRNAII